MTHVRRFSFVRTSKQNETKEAKKNLRRRPRVFPEYGEAKIFPAKTIGGYLNEVENMDKSVFRKDPSSEQQLEPFPQIQSKT